MVAGLLSKSKCYFLLFLDCYFNQLAENKPPSAITRTQNWGIMTLKTINLHLVQNHLGLIFKCLKVEMASSDYHGSNCSGTPNVSCNVS